MHFLVDLFFDNFWEADERFVVIYTPYDLFGHLEVSGRNSTSARLPLSVVQELMTLAEEELAHLGFQEPLCEDSTVIQGLVVIGSWSRAFQSEICGDGVDPAIERFLSLAGANRRSRDH